MRTSAEVSSTSSDVEFWVPELKISANISMWQQQIRAVRNNPCEVDYSTWLWILQYCTAVTKRYWCTKIYWNAWKRLITLQEYSPGILMQNSSKLSQFTAQKSAEMSLDNISLFWELTNAVRTCELVHRSNERALSRMFKCSVFNSTSLQTTSNLPNFADPRPW